METAVFAEIDGVVEEVVAAVGTHVDAEDLLLVVPTTTPTPDPAISGHRAGGSTIRGARPARRPRSALHPARPPAPTVVELRRPR